MAIVLEARMSAINSLIGHVWSTSTFRLAGSIRVLDVFALGLARVPVRFAIGAAHRLVHLVTDTKFRCRLLWWRGFYTISFACGA